MSHSDLASYYQTTYIITRRLSFSLTEIENMFPFERDIYLEMFIAELEERQKRENQS